MNIVKITSIFQILYRNKIFCKNKHSLRKVDAHVKPSNKC